MVTWPHDGIVPVELWDVLRAGRTLFARRDEPSFFASLAVAALAARKGDAVREAGERLAALPWATVAIAGGGVDEAMARDAFAAAGADVALLSTDAMFAARGALPLARAVDPSAVVVDAGQTAVKAAGPRGTVVRPRLPAGDFIDEVAWALRATSDATTSFVLLALPCEVAPRSGAIALGASTYPTEGDGAVLSAEILRRAGLPHARAALVNDAVLAAQVVSSSLAAGALPLGRCLVLTVGHGVGAAFVRGKDLQRATS